MRNCPLPGVSVKTQARSPWKQARHGKNAMHVGEFCQHLGLAILGGELCDPFNNHPGGDILNLELGFAADVKSAGNNNSFRLSVQQKKRHSDIPFPLDHFLYCLCSYRSIGWFAKGIKKPRGVKGNTFSALDRLRTRREQFEFIAKKIDEVYLFDIDVMDQLELLLGVKNGTTPGREEDPTLRLWRGDIRSFRNGSFKTRIKEVGLNPKDWSLGKHEMKVSFSLGEYRYQPEFTLYTILRKRFGAKLVRARGFGASQSPS